jgi:6-phosphogluconolactonase (cycloisomerase 2 family)
VLYATDTLVNSLSPLNINTPGGALSAASGQYFIGGTPLSVAVDPLGRFVYTANEGSDDLSAFTIGAGSVLTPAVGSPFLTGKLPQFVAINSTGAHLYSANAGDNTVSAFSIDATSGALSSIAGGPIAVSGQGPAKLALHPGGRFIYVGYRSTADLTVLSVDPSTGGLSIVGSAVASGAINAIGIEPSGKYLYVTTGFAVEGFAIDGATGLLQPIPNGSFSGNVRPQALAIGPSGTFLFAPDNSSNAVIALSINQTDGGLTPVPGSPFPLDPSYTLGLGPTSIAVSR